MKALIAGVLILVSSAFAHATTTCTGSNYVSIPSEYVSLNCNHGSCSGWINSQYLNISDRCDGDITFNASATIPSQYINGFCNGGSISAYVPSQSVMVQGRCSDGNLYDGDLYLNSQSLFGSCQPDGFSSVWVNSQFVPVRGSCR